MHVVIIISLYNAKQYLPDLFGSLFRYYRDKDWVKIIAIDDQSQDGGFEALKQEYSWVDAIQSETNCGFAKANNIATEYAIKNYDPEFLFYLNQDTEVEEGFLEKLVATMKSNEQIGIVQPLLMIHPFSSSLINSRGNQLHFLGYGYTGDEGDSVLSFQRKLESRQKNQKQKDLDSFDVSVRFLDSESKPGMAYEDIGYACGAAFLTRTDIVKKIGLFDPYYVAYHEDTDLSLRVKQLGCRVVLCHESRIAHKYTTPEQVKNKKQTNHNAYYWIERNRFVLFAKFWTTRMLILFFPAFVINEIGVMVFSLFRGFWKERLNMYGWLFTHIGELKKIRRASLGSGTGSHATTDNSWERQLMDMLASEIWHGNADSFVLGLANVFWKGYFTMAKFMLSFLRKQESKHRHQKQKELKPFSFLFWFSGSRMKLRDDNTLKIAHVVSTSPPYEGGMGTVAVNLVNELRRLGHEADLISPGYGLEPWFRYGNANFNPQLLWKLRKYNIVHLHYAFFGGAEFILFAKLLGLLKAKLVIHYHNDVVGIGVVRPIVQLDEALFLKPLFHCADAVIALSEFHLKHSKQLSRYWRLIQDKVHVLPNGIDPERFSPREKDQNLVSSLQVPKDAVVVMYAGAIDNAHYFKGIEDLIRAFQLAYQKNQKLFLLVIGGGDRERYMMELAQELLAIGSYVFAGSVPNSEMPRYMSLGDVLVLPSFEVESFGIVLVEALAVGKPVIASDLPSLDEVVRNDSIGLRFKRRDANDLAEKILEMGKRCTTGIMGLLGRQHVVERYSWEKIGKKLDEMYKSL